MPSVLRDRALRFLVAGLIGLVSTVSVALAQKRAAQAKSNQTGAEFTIKAKQAILMDADSGAVLFQHNADELMPPASMSKLMTLAVVFRAIKTGQIKLDDEFLMSENAWRKGGAPSGTSAMFVPLGSKAKVSELVTGIIVQSGNDAAISLAENIAGSESAFAKLMEDEAKRLGLSKSTFRNATGLYHPDHLMTARELAQLGRFLTREYPDYAPIFVQREMNYTEPKPPFKKHRFINRNPLLYLNLGVDGLKTGSLKESGYGMVATAKQDQRRLILVVNGLASGEERKEEAKRMLEWGFRAFGEFKLFDAGEIVGRARVLGGDRMFVPLTGNGDLNVVLPRFPANQKLKAEVVYMGPLKPPIRRGDVVARLRVTSSTEATSEVPLYAAEDVQPVGTLRRGFDTLLHMGTRWLP
jgi:D-alanyl-D-alanine carboxypeptidase (penicillin-binding protein 5/6)